MRLWTLYYTSHEEIFHRYMAIFMRPRFEKLVIFIPLLRWLLFCCLCKVVSLIRNFLVVSKTWKLICIRKRTTCYRSDQAFSFKIYHSRFTPYVSGRKIFCAVTRCNTGIQREMMNRSSKFWSSNSVYNNTEIVCVGRFFLLKPLAPT